MIKSGIVIFKSKEATLFNDVVNKMLDPNTKDEFDKDSFYIFYNEYGGCEVMFYNYAINKWTLYKPLDEVNPYDDIHDLLQRNSEFKEMTNKETTNENS